MVLKRVLMAVFAATGLVGTAVFGQTTGGPNPTTGGEDHTHSTVGIPAPADFETLAACIRGQTDPRNTAELKGDHGDVAEDTFSILTIAACESIMRGSGATAATIESLSDLIAAARTKTANELGTDFSDDDFDEMVAELKANFGGDVLDRVIDEYIAEERASDARTAYNDRLDDLNGDEDGTPTYADATSGYNGIAFEADDTALEDTSGINIDGVVKVDSILSDGTTTTDLTLPTVSKTNNKVTEDSELSNVDVGTADSYDITYATVETLLADITELTDAKKDYQALQNSGAPLTRSERRNLAGLIEAIDDALPLLEAKRDAVLALESTPTSGDRSNTDINNAVAAVKAYNDAKSTMDGRRRTLNNRIEDLDDAKQALYDAIADPAKHLQQLVTSTDRDDDATQTAKDSITNLKQDYDDAAAEGTTSGTLLKALIAQKDTGGALVDAVKELQTAMDDGDGDGGGDASALTMMDDPATDEDERGLVTKNTDNIKVNTDDIKMNKEDISHLESVVGVDTESQHVDLDACAAGANSLLNQAACNKARTEHNAGEIVTLDGRVTANEGTLKDHATKLGEKKAYIETLQGEVGIDAMGNGTEDNGMSRIDNNETRSMANATEIGMDENGMSRIDHNESRSMQNATDIEGLDGRVTQNESDIANLAGEGRTDETVMGNAGAIAQEVIDRTAADDALGVRIDDEAMAREAADTAEMNARVAADDALGVRIDDEEMARMAADTAEMNARMEADTAIRGEFAAADTEEMNARMAEDTAIRSDFASADSMVRSDLTGMINSNTGMITDNRNMIGELSDDLGVVRAGVAASMALAGMPAVNGRGIAIGVGSFDGESAFAVGFQIAGEQASFKVGVTSSGGATGASAGVGFNF